MVDDFVGDYEMNYSYGKIVIYNSVLFLIMY
jgi:hypothetical protein